MKKIREILFTIVMIVSCGCLLNVGTYAMLPQNNGNTNMKSVPGESLSNDLEGKQSPSRHETSSEWLISNVAADNDGTVLFFTYPYGPCGRVTTYYTNMVDGTMVVEASTYTKLSKVCVFPGQAVKKGQKIGERKSIGPAGHSTGSHLHFQAKLNGVDYNPLDGDHEETYKFDNTNNQGRRLKPYGEWLAEYEKNKREGNFTEPSVFMEEGEQVTEEQENSWLLRSSLNEEGENACSSPSFATRIETIPEFSVSTLPPPIHTISSTSICAEDEDNSTDDIPAQTEIDDSDIYDTDNIF